MEDPPSARVEAVWKPHAWLVSNFMYAYKICETGVYLTNEPLDTKEFYVMFIFIIALF